jgi:hypothetical protein
MDRQQKARIGAGPHVEGDVGTTAKRLCGADRDAGIDVKQPIGVGDRILIDRHCQATVEELERDGSVKLARIHEGAGWYRPANYRLVARRYIN